MILPRILCRQAKLLGRKFSMTMRRQDGLMKELLQLHSASGCYQQVPLIVIIGATGCGKTKLSIELARRYSGEVISADSMQIYKGLDIATNKAAAEEQAEVPHHLLDEVDPFKQFTVLDFQKLAMQKIDSILARQKIPIIVGGTNYYIESILWDTLVGSADHFELEEMNIVENGQQPEESISEDASETRPLQVDTIEQLMQQKITYRRLQSIASETLHQFLVEIDPVSAASLHPQNKRKIIRCLQVYQQTGKRFSDILAEQHKAGSRHGGPLRFANSIILWVDCDKEVLEKRLDERVDQMIQLGLVKELQQFHLDYNDLRLRQNRKADYTEGIFQAIGLKEFHRYLLMDEEMRNSYDGSLALGNGIILLKQRTKSYVTKQLKWIRRRFLVSESVRKVPNVYRLDTTHPERWKEAVFDRSVEVIDRTLEALLVADETIRQDIRTRHLDPLCANRRQAAEEDDAFVSGQFFCDICQLSVSGGQNYELHLKSKGHRSKLRELGKAESRTVQVQA